MDKTIKIENPITLNLHKDGASPTRKPQEMQILKNYMPNPGDLEVRNGVTLMFQTAVASTFTFTLYTKNWLTSGNRTTRVFVPGQGFVFPPAVITLSASTDLTVPDAAWFDYWTPASPNTPTRTFTSADDGLDITAWYAPTPV
jgi:hypothetical protein